MTTYRLISVVPILRKINAIYANNDGSFYRRAVIGIQTYVEAEGDSYGNDGPLQWCYLEEHFCNDEEGNVGPEDPEGFIGYEDLDDLDADQQTRDRHWKMNAEMYAAEKKEKEEARKREEEARKRKRREEKEAEER